MEFLDRGLSPLPLVPHGKAPLTEALPRVRGRPSWKPYQTHAPTPEDIGLWYADYGPGLNIGLVTGYPGALCLYVVDIDGPVIPASLVACHTTTVRTGRPGGGWHLYFYGSEGYRSGRYVVDGTSVEFKGVCSYVVAPPSIHASGTGYTFTEGLSAIQPLPGVLMDQLKAQFLSDIPRGDGPATRDRSCLDQIWNRPLLEGERDKALYALYQGLLRAGHGGHREDYARLWTEKKNAMLAVPLTDRELLKITMRGPEAKRPGHTYGVGCPWTKANLPWVNCNGCHYLNEGVRHMTNGYEAIQALQDKDVSGATFKVYFALIRAEQDTGIRDLSLTKLQEQTGLSRTAVIEAKQTLKDKGYL